MNDDKEIVIKLDVKMNILFQHSRPSEDYQTMEIHVVLILLASLYADKNRFNRTAKIR